MRLANSDPESVDFKFIQIIQNNLLRTLNGSRIKDMISIRTLLTRFDMLSINQLNAQIKLQEIWKALNIDDYPLKVQRQFSDFSRVNTRADATQKPVEIGRSLLVQKTCVSDAISLWNKAPTHVTSCTSLSQAKTEIKKFVRQLPI